MTAHIVVNSETFRLGSSGPSTGEIWIVLDGGAFPALGWNDFIVVILEAWLGALLRLLRGASQLERVHFMEGPHEVEVRRLTSGLLQLCALDRGIAKFRTNVSAAPLAEDALIAAKSVLEACRQVGDTSIDAERLEQALTILQEEVAKARN
jgi:hypothetical protein